jgi:hypothetical protein
MVDIESKAIIETIVEEVGEFSLESIPLLLPKLIIHVQQFKNMNGKQKKDIIIKMLKHIVDITDGPGDDAIWDPILKKLIPGLIDTLLEVENGKLKLKKKKTLLFCC